MANFCENCGAPLIPGTKFCTECGYQLPTDAPAPAAAPTIPPAAVPRPASAKQGDEIRRAVPKHRITEQKPPVQEAKPDIRTQAPEQPVPVQPQRSAPVKSKGSTGLAVFLSVLMLAEAAFAGFKYPGWFKKEDSGTGQITSGGSADNSGNQTPAVKHVSRTAPTPDPALLSALGITQEQLNQYCQDPIEITSQNSPGNPAFIDVTFTQEEYDRAETLSAPVSWEQPEADFPAFGIHADLKWWNLENETDTLIIKKMPVKTCPVTGSTLYTYDYSLASGQNSFPTEVEITVPIQGDKEIFDGMLHYNSDTGEWEEDYYTLSEDGTSCTVYMTHFSDGAQRSGTEMKDKLIEAGVTASAFYQSDGKSLFRLMPYEDVSKYQGVESWLYGVGLVPIPDFEVLLEGEDRIANAVLKALLEGSGGVPAEAGLSETAATLGFVDDSATTGQTLLDQMKVIDGSSGASMTCSYFLTAAGIILLALRAGDQYLRGVDGWNIVDSNRWGAASSVVGLCGLVGAAIGAAPVAIFCSVACSAIFVATYVGSANEAAHKAKYPLGEGETLEEMAFNYYVSDYNDGTENAVQNALRRVIAKIPPPDGAAHALGHDTQINIRGTGWAQAFDYILKHYRQEPAKMTQAVMELYQEYETYIDHFFDGMNGQAGDNAKLRDLCWRQSIAAYLSRENAPELRYNPNVDMEGQIAKFSAAHPTLSDETVNRCVQLVAWAEGKDESWNDIWSGYNADDLIGQNGLGADTLGDIQRFRKIDSKQMSALKQHARKVLYENTNPMIYALYKRYHDDAVKEARDKLLDDVLPFFNTQITFYIDDHTLAHGNRSDTKYTSFAFTDQRSSALFQPANKEAMHQVLRKQLTLKKNEGKPILLVTNTYNYIRWGCPTQVVVADGLDKLDGKADWAQTEFKTDKYSMYSGLPEKQRELLLEEFAVHMIQDVRVPISYKANNTKDMVFHLGIYEDDIAGFTDHGETGKPINYNNTVTITLSDEEYKPYSSQVRGTIEISLPELTRIIEDRYADGTLSSTKTIQRGSVLLQGKISDISSKGFGEGLSGSITTAPSKISATSTEVSYSLDKDQGPITRTNQRSLSNPQCIFDDSEMFDGLGRHQYPYEKCVFHIDYDWDKNKLKKLNIILYGDFQRDDGSIEKYDSDGGNRRYIISLVPQE